MINCALIGWSLAGFGLGFIAGAVTWVVCESYVEAKKQPVYLISKEEEKNKPLDDKEIG